MDDRRGTNKSLLSPREYLAISPRSICQTMVVRSSKVEHFPLLKKLFAYVLSSSSFIHITRQNTSDKSQLKTWFL